MRKLTAYDLARPAIAALPAKSHANAKSPAVLQAELGLAQLVPMNNNENPLGSSPLAIAAIREAAAQVNRYPDSDNTAIRAKLAEKYAVTPDMIICANGADNLITALMKAFLGEGESMVIGDPAFPVYEAQARSMGGQVVKVPLGTDMAFDLPAMLAAMDSSTKLAVVINPHNPTGAAVSRQALADFMDKLPDHVLLVLDEAYIDFTDPATFPDALPYAREGRNVLILRTFSKFMGLAGLRIGYAIAPFPVIDILHRVVETFSVNMLTQAACLAALDDVEFAAASRAACAEAKAYFCREFDRLGLTYPVSQANFLFVNVGVDSTELAQRLLKQGFLVCPCQSFGFPQHLRLSFGTPEQNRRFIQALEEDLAAMQ